MNPPQYSWVEESKLGWTDIKPFLGGCTSSRFLTNFGRSRRNRNINVHLYATDGLVHRLTATWPNGCPTMTQLRGSWSLQSVSSKARNMWCMRSWNKPMQICGTLFESQNYDDMLGYVLMFFFVCFFTYFFLSFFLSFGSACVGDYWKMMWYFSPVSGVLFSNDRWLLASEHNGTIQVRQQRCEFSQTPFNGTLCDS